MKNSDQLNTVINRWNALPACPGAYPCLAGGRLATVPGGINFFSPFSSFDMRLCKDIHFRDGLQLSLIRMQGGDQDAVQAVLACELNSDALTSQQRILLQFAKKITEDSQAITPPDIEAMRTAGWNDLQIAETIHVTALFATFNRVANAFALPSQQLLSTLEQETAGKL